MMKIWLYCLALVLLAVITVEGAAVNNNIPKNRIIGGTPAAAIAFAWQAALFVSSNNGKYFCSGALISTSYVLSSGICLEGSTEIEVHLGTIYSDATIPDPNRRIVSSSEVTLHPDFNSQNFENDIGVLKLRLPVQLSDYLKTISMHDGEITENIVITIAGWGQTSDDVEAPIDSLLWAHVVSITNDECKVTYGSIINDNILCAVGQNTEGTCVGDTGGPVVLVVGGGVRLIAISSFISGNGCETPEPSGFTRMSSYYEWVTRVIQTE